MWSCGRNWPSGFSSSSTAEEVTRGIDAAGLTAIVTGATSGIGLETARVLALRGVRVVMGALFMAEGFDTKAKLLKDNPCAQIDVFELDLSSLESVRSFAAQFLSLGLPLHILINNAGICMVPFKLSKDGVEMQFATNYLGHFLLTNLLLDTLKKSAAETEREGRIVSVASEGHRASYKGGIRLHKLNLRKGYNRVFAYGQSKLALILHSKELTKRLKEDGANVTANSVHPGMISGTNIAQHITFFRCMNTCCAPFVNPMLKTTQLGASTTCYVALHPQVKGISGEYFADNNLAKPSAKTADEALATKLWDFTLTLTAHK